MLDKGAFGKLPLNERLDAQINSLSRIMEMYEGLSYKNPQYRREADAISDQLKVLCDLRDGVANNSWYESYQEDLEEYNNTYNPYEKEREEE
ncbi:MAG: hypothetical protein AB9844_03460 [Clostridiaceae bacterium]